MANIAITAIPVTTTKGMSHAGRFDSTGVFSEAGKSGVDGRGNGVVGTIVGVAVTTGVIPGTVVATVIAAPALVNPRVSMVSISPSSLIRTRLPVRFPSQPVSRSTASLTPLSVVPVRARKARVSFQGEGINCTSPRRRIARGPPYGDEMIVLQLRF